MFRTWPHSFSGRGVLLWQEPGAESKHDKLRTTGTKPKHIKYLAHSTCTAPVVCAPPVMGNILHSVVVPEEALRGPGECSAPVARQGDLGSGRELQLVLKMGGVCVWEGSLTTSSAKSRSSTKKSPGRQDSGKVGRVSYMLQLFPAESPETPSFLHHKPTTALKLMSLPQANRKWRQNTTKPLERGYELVSKRHHEIGHLLRHNAAPPVRKNDDVHVM